MQAFRHGHRRDHIMLKIKVPVDDSLVSGAHNFARELTHSTRQGHRDDHRTPGHRLDGEYSHGQRAWSREPRQYHPPPTSHWRWGQLPPPPPGLPHFAPPPPPPWHIRGLPPPPSFPTSYYPAEPPMYYGDEAGHSPEQRGQSVDSARPLRHHADCSHCGSAIMGVRWTCANCPSNPTYNLVSQHMPFNRPELVMQADARPIISVFDL